MEARVCLSTGRGAGDHRKARSACGRSSRYAQQSESFHSVKLGEVSATRACEFNAWFRYEVNVVVFECCRGSHV
jgi:hypothetical protein